MKLSNHSVKHILFYAVLTLVGCTKESPYEYEHKENVESKAIIDTEAEYLYVPSMMNTSRTTSETRPYALGEQKRVKFKFTEKYLQIFEIESDARYKTNEANQKLVMSIPVEHHEYRCALNNYQECTNKEEENKDLVWNQKSLFKPDFAGVKITDVNILPLEVEKLFGGGCFTEEESHFKGYTLEADALNFEIEKTFKMNLLCNLRVENLSDLSITAIYHYSFAKLNSVTSPDYIPVTYNNNDQNTFGFFTTETKKLDVDNNDTVKSEKTLLNRWNPNKNKIVYYLSSEFQKPENAVLKKATEKAFEKLNQGLEAAQVKFRLELQDGTGKSPGDLRNNFVVMVEDPIDSGLLGYGPAVTNPVTGEIISARTVMYPGVMKQFIKWTYDDIYKENKLQKLKNSENNTVAKFTLSQELQEQLNTLKAKIQTVDVSSGLAASSPLSQTQVAVPKNMNLSANKTLDAKNIAKMKEELFGSKLAKQTVLKETDRIGLMSKYCTYPAELFNFDQAVESSLKLKMNGDLKAWDEMSDEEKQSTVDIILPAIWIPTLVHEMGHNLGLRHNFKGSEDKNNFYTDEELKAHNVDHAVPYSSVMDYAYSDLNSLPALGKYDIAALRFGYLRQVESTDGQMLNVEFSVEELKTQTKVELKKYEYCTDENVEVNVGCKRFDEGTTFAEIALHEIKSYEDSYNRRYTRSSRRNFSVMSDISTASRLQDMMNHLRFNFEKMSSIKATYGVDYNDPLWESLPFLKDIKSAAIISGRFLIETMLEPTLTCLAAQSDTNELVAYKPLNEITQNTLSCEQIKLDNKNLKIVGSIGKPFNSLKDPSSDDPRMDQIDIRGNWIAKVMAAKTLLDRNIDNLSWDKTDDSFLDLPELRDEVLTAIQKVVEGGTTTVQTVTLNNGQVLELPIESDFTDSHIIENPLSESVKRFLDMPDRNVRYQELLVATLKNSLSKVRFIENSSDNEAKDQFSVYNLLKFAPLPRIVSDKKTSDYLVLPYDDRQFVATDRNLVARNIITDLITVKKLKDFDKSEVLEAFKKLISGELKNLKKASEVEKTVANLDQDVVAKYLLGNIKSNEYLMSMLTVLAK